MSQRFIRVDKTLDECRQALDARILAQGPLLFGYFSSDERVRGQTDESGFVLWRRMGTKGGHVYLDGTFEREKGRTKIRMKARLGYGGSLSFISLLLLPAVGAVHELFVIAERLLASARADGIASIGTVMFQRKTNESFAMALIGIAFFRWFWMWWNYKIKEYGDEMIKFVEHEFGVSSDVACD